MNTASPINEILDLLEKTASYAENLEKQIAILEAEKSASEIVPEEVTVKLAAVAVKSGLIDKSDAEKFASQMRDPRNVCGVLYDVLSHATRSHSSRGIPIYPPEDSIRAGDGWSTL